MRRAIVISILLLVSGVAVYYFYPEKRLATGIKIDKLVAYKAKHKLYAYSNGTLVKTYPIAIGQNPVGKKEFEGDRKTPEGSYIIFNKNPNSQYHKNLGISYPNENDRARAKSLGKPPGGDVKLHGCNNKQSFLGKFQRWHDWTHGCIALTNEEIDELYDHVAIGTLIIIEP